MTISIHAPHEGERPTLYLGTASPSAISIHAPHEGERLIFFLCFSCVFYFNPRSPRGGATLCHMSFQSAYKTFQSTLPTRGSDA